MLQLVGCYLHIFGRRVLVLLAAHHPAVEGGRLLGAATAGLRRRTVAGLARGLSAVAGGVGVALTVVGRVGVGEACGCKAPAHCCRDDQAYLDELLHRALPVSRTNQPHWLTKYILP